jgi:hypothetical protein
LPDEKENRIDLRGDGRIILYKRAGLKDPVWQVRVRVPNSTGYKRVTTKTADQREAERFAVNYYEDLYIHVKTGGSIKSKTFKQVFAEWEKHVATMGHTRRGGSWDETIERVRTYALCANSQFELIDCYSENYYGLINHIEGPRLVRDADQLYIGSYIAHPHGLLYRNLCGGDPLDIINAKN